ncbi:MAG: helix-turn-helix domain-containing protein [Bacillota bacterium]
MFRTDTQQKKCVPANLGNCDAWLEGTTVDIGERIRALRFQRGMTQADVAGNGLSRSYISSLEHGRFIPSEKALAIIAANLGVSVNVLIGSDQPRETSQTVRRLLRTVRLSRSVSLREQVGLLKLATHVAKSSGDTLVVCEHVLSQVLQHLSDLADLSLTFIVSNNARGGLSSDWVGFKLRSPTVQVIAPWS